uniref:Retrovirus-related Pol polyprotein from transposon TNT 1-94 n=1 Tax=Populus alba TaxID=43335 RepID=A0A4U5Q6J9_POPAL|nr:hypothetical protein D5086_0000128830 [Populus alba]
MADIPEERLAGNASIPPQYIPVSSTKFEVEKFDGKEQNSVKELWQALEDKFIKKSIGNCPYLKKRIFHFQHKKGTSMNDHLNDFNKMIVDMKNLDVEINDEDKALLLLNSLPNTYEHLVTTLLYGKEKIKFIDVSNALVNNEYRKKDQIVHKESTSKALTVRGRTNPRRFRG